ncbi:MAG: formyltransferase family protein, partial [candidate division KSB1 bacterium]|nr:formyltransferase family protein [candidate division KSB1 bacterium]
MKLIFMGTPQFAVPSLDALLNSRPQVVAVVTGPDRPAGRGLQLKPSAVKRFALARGLQIFQPEKLNDETFVNQLKSFEADLFVVVAFRILPPTVFQIP